MQKNKTTAWWIGPTITAVVIVLGWWLLPQLFGVRAVYLWTDRLIVLLVIMVIYLASFIRQKEHLREPWRRIFRRKLAMASLVVLAAYIIVGLLDSIHFRTPLPKQEGQTQVHYSVEVLSVMDVMMDPIRQRIEKTYSAPFATHLYSKVSRIMPDGSKQRVYPRLKYGGAHLQNPRTDKAGDIVYRLVLSVVAAVFMWLVLTVLVAYWLHRRQAVPIRISVGNVLGGKTEVPWHVTLYTLLVLLFVVMIGVYLGTHYHIFGTDKVGNDVFYLAIKSIRTGLVIGTLTTLVMLPFAILLGIMAGYFKGWVDDVIQYMYTTLSSIPGVLLIAAAILSIQVYIANHPNLFETGTDRADLRLLALCVIMGITSWTSLCRLLRGETLKIREVDYIQAATAFGVSHLRIISRHILPNVMHIVLIIIVLDFSGLVLAEAVLSYVGVGVDPSTTSWGNMINGARLELGREPMVWWSLAASFCFMFVLVLAANLFSDAVRDAFDPRLRKGK
jgi:peptide/nickel transport system permease protein